jgi:F0F1-type ATP synthase epsilon subunit
MQLILVSPEKKETIEVAWVELNTPSGNYIIQSGHAPMALALTAKQPFIYALKNGKEEIVMVERGIAEITRSQVIILLS